LVTQGREKLPRSERKGFAPKSFAGLRKAFFIPVIGFLMPVFVFSRPVIARSRSVIVFLWAVIGFSTTVIARAGHAVTF